MRYIENEEDEEYETNQYLVGMKELFRGYVVVDWEGTEITNDKFRVLNVIVAKKCIEFYTKYWKHRNEAYHDGEKQRLRIKKWFLNERENALNSRKVQIKQYATKFDIDSERSSVETMKIWIKNKKILEKKITNILSNDIRRYLNLMTVSDRSRGNANDG